MPKLLSSRAKTPANFAFDIVRGSKVCKVLLTVSSEKALALRWSINVSMLIDAIVPELTVNSPLPDFLAA